MMACKSGSVVFRGSFREVAQDLVSEVMLLEGPGEGYGRRMHSLLRYFLHFELRTTERKHGLHFPTWKQVLTGKPLIPAILLLQSHATAYPPVGPRRSLTGSLLT